MLEYPMKLGILEVQRRGNLADSDPRLQVKAFQIEFPAKFPTAARLLYESSGPGQPRRFFQIGLRHVFFGLNFCERLNNHA
jgi:hypothetical protein